MQKFHHIESLRNARQYAERFLPADQQAVIYLGTVKLHGSCMSVVCTPDALITQSRANVITPEKDCYGFSAHMSQAIAQRAIRALERYIRSIEGIAEATPLVLHGEWVGPGIQKGVAVSQLPQKQWVIFGVATVEADGEQHFVPTPTFGAMRDKDLMAEASIHSIMSAPVFGPIIINYADTENLAMMAAEIEKWVAQVEQECPWGAKFGVQGVGEGIVFTPVSGPRALTFKAKGAKHKVDGTKGEKIKVEPVEGVDEFVRTFATIPRFDQGIETLMAEGRGSLTMKDMGAFLRWLAEDIQREGAAELEVSNLTWKQVQGAITATAVKYFKSQVSV